MSKGSGGDRLIGGIYLIVDPDHCPGGDVERVASAAAANGVAAIQLRHKGAAKKLVADEARKIVEICRQFGTLFFVNDHPDVAAEVGADGVHVGQNDLGIADCRAILKPRQLVGKSNATVDEAMASEAEGADYVAVGAVFPTDTKSNTRPAGLETLRSVADEVSKPLVAIGGIKPDNIHSVANAGADAACVATAISLAGDPGEATRLLVSQFAEARASR